MAFKFPFKLKKNSISQEEHEQIVSQKITDIQTRQAQELVNTKKKLEDDNKQLRAALRELRIRHHKLASQTAVSKEVRAHYLLQKDSETLKVITQACSRYVNTVGNTTMSEFSRIISINSIENRGYNPVQNYLGCIDELERLVSIFVTKIAEDLAKVSDIFENWNLYKSQYHLTSQDEKTLKDFSLFPKKIESLRVDNFANIIKILIDSGLNGSLYSSYVTYIKKIQDSGKEYDPKVFQQYVLGSIGSKSGYVKLRDGFLIFINIKNDLFNLKTTYEKYLDIIHRIDSYDHVKNSEK